MKEHPILFSRDMVRAILTNRKTQTRRLVKYPSDYDGGQIWDNGRFGLKYSSTKFGGTVQRLQPKWSVGDRLWVRETWAKVCHSEDGQCYGEECLECGFEYRADKPTAKWAGDWDSSFDGKEVPDGCKWKPSIFMPRAASRITLEITGVSVEKLQDISYDDAIAEGIEDLSANGYWWDYMQKEFSAPTPQASYMALWDSINGPEAHKANPYVWVIKFEVL